MKSRPYASYSFVQLSKLVEKKRKDNMVLNLILHELSKRKKNRSIPALIKEVEQAIADCPPQEKEKVVGVEEMPVRYGHQIHRDNTKSTVKVPENWDAEQRTVIELAEDETKIVEAGPGAGKTAVACARVAHLIEHCDLEASKIFLISFTRTAVKELRDRIELFAKHPINVAGLQIFTLDSFTWQVLRGLGDDDSANLMSSYETNIKKFIQQLKDGDPQVLDYFAEFEHVVLDEGQDLVGDRAELAIQIVSNLEVHCGVTVFADSAQAIYGFTDDSEQHGSHRSLTVVERIMQGEILGFERIKLINVHRTDDPKLKKLFKQGRDRLLDQKESDVEAWKAMKQLIVDCSHGQVGKIEDQGLADKPDHLVLFRTRAEVLQASSFLWSKGVGHKLRMSGIQQRVHPWIGRLLGDYLEDYLEREVFNKLWKAKIGYGAGASPKDRDDAWQLLIDNVGDEDDRVRVVRLREILSRDRPPIDFLVEENQLAGPVLGTIHASKGREANQVHLMLPPDQFMDENPASDYSLSPHEIAEEQRVLFVGATRAKQKLMIGKGVKMYASRYGKRRTYKKPRKWKNARLIEMGLTGDIDTVSIADGRLGDEHEALQLWLWEHATSQVELATRFDHGLKSNVLWSVNDDVIIAVLSKRFDKDIWGIAEVVSKKNGGKKHKPASTIKCIRMVGATTIAIPESQRENIAPPWRHSGFMLAPVITGFPMVFFNQWNKN